METKFQRINLHFRGPAIEWDFCEYCPTKPGVEILHGGLLTEITYILASNGVIELVDVRCQQIQKNTCALDIGDISWITGNLLEFSFVDTLS